MAIAFTDADLQRVVDAVHAAGSQRAAVEALGLKKSTIGHHMLRAAERGLVPTVVSPPIAEGTRTIAAPEGWCDLSREDGWVRRCYGDDRRTETVERRAGDFEQLHVTFDPGAVYPPDWTGPLVDKIKVQRRTFDHCKRYFGSYIQDRTPAIGPAYNAMLAYAQFLGAQIVLGQGTHNRDWFRAIFGGTKRRDDTCVEHIRDFSSVFDGLSTPKRFEMAPALDFLPNFNISPTATNPLSGLNTSGRGRSALFAHPRQELQSVPRHYTDDPVITLTTGAMTSPNYVDRKTGHLARFHHVAGFVIVEVDPDGNHWHRHVHCDLETGRFQDLDVIVDGHGRITTGNPINLICADGHHHNIDPVVADGTWFAPDSIAKTIEIDEMVCHDTLDFWSQNHHNRKSPLHAWEVKVRGVTVEGEIAEDAGYLDRVAPAARRVMIAAANHNEAMTK